MKFKIGQIGLVLCVMASLLVGHVSACGCPSHEAAKTEESACPFHHEAAADVEASESGDRVDEQCICVVEQPSPYVASQQNNRSRVSAAANALTSQLPGLEWIAVARSTTPAPVFVRHLSYSSAVSSLLPSRAPPRL
jgi:hypothetical protein